MDNHCVDRQYAVVFILLIKWFIREHENLFVLSGMNTSMLPNPKTEYRPCLYDNVYYDNVYYDNVYYDNVYYDNVYYDNVYYDNVYHDNVYYDNVYYDNVYYDVQCSKHVD